MCILNFALYAVSVRCSIEKGGKWQLIPSVSLSASAWAVLSYSSLGYFFFSSFCYLEFEVLVFLLRIVTIAVVMDSINRIIVVGCSGIMIISSCECL